MYKRRGTPLLIIVLMTLVCLLFDLISPLGVAAGVPYVVVVLIVHWSPWQRYIYHAATLTTVLTVVGYLASPPGGVLWVVMVNRGLAIFIIWMAALLCKRIQQEAANLQAVFDTSADGIISTNENGIVQTFNRKAVAIFGYSAEEVIGNNISMLMPSPDREKHDGYVQRFIKTGEKRIIGKGRQLQARHKDGHVFPIHLNVGETHLGQNYIFTGVVRDLSDEEQRETQLQRLWYVVEQSPISIIITDVNGNIEYVNTCFKQLTGYTDKEVLGKNPSILKSGHTQVEAYRHLWSTIAGGHIWRGVLQNQKKNGELFWISSTIYPITNQQGDIDRYIAFNEDITYLREKEDMLTHAMKLEAVGRMTNGIAHDFRNLLTVILGNLQLLQDGVIKKESELIADALSAAHDGSELIMRLLTFSRRKERSIQTVEVNTFLQDLQRLLHRMVDDNINISLDLSEVSISVKADPNRLESAILNLVTNAQDAMPNGGNLTISSDIDTINGQEMTGLEDIHPGDYVTITVSDNGLGMSEETRVRALEAFYSTKSSGTGLGLSMVNEFIHASDGTITIDSSPGIGTSIALYLPFVETLEQYDIKNTDIDKLPSGTETILLAEDSVRVRVFACRILTHLGYKVIETSNAGEAMGYIRQHKDIDLLFTDIVMPGEMNGCALAAKATKQLSSLKVLLTTGMVLQENDYKSLPINYPLLTKPYTALQMAQSIRSVLDTGELTD